MIERARKRKRNVEKIKRERERKREKYRRSPSQMFLKRDSNTGVF